MVTTRGGADTASKTNSSPASQKKRRAEPDTNEISSFPVTKRKKLADNAVPEKLAVRSHPDAAPLPTETETAKATAKAEGLTQPALPLRNHIRFSSTSPPPLQGPRTALPKPQPVVETKDDEESDDDAAPETISLSTAQAQTRAVEEHTEQIAKELSEAAKRRRRRRDAQLKAQVAGSTRRKVKEMNRGANKEADVETASVKEEDDDDKSPVVVKAKSPKPSYSLDNIPDILPDELLTTEAPLKLLAPPQSSKPSQTKDKKATEAFIALKIQRETAPKDLTYDNLKVRVLTQKNPLLPPPAASRSTGVRESWLRGRPSFERMTRKGKGGGKLQRRDTKAGKTFV